MKIRMFAVLVPALLAAFNFQPVTAFAQGTAFTYQGQFQSGGNPVNGSYDLSFTLYPTTNLTASPIAGPVTNTAVAVTNGLFTTLVNFGPGAFTGTSNWLAVAVSLSGTNNFSLLAPRQQVTPTPYALVAGSAGGLNGLTIQQNIGSAPNYILGAADNFIAAGVDGATIGGGTNISIGASWSGVGGGYGNSIGTASYVSWLGGGLGNVISSNSTYAVLGGGQNNTIQAYTDHEFIGGGDGNVIEGGIQGGFVSAVSYSAIVGGNANGIWLGAQDSFIGGGSYNAIQSSAQQSVLGGGSQNNILGGYSFLGGGVNNTVQGGQEETLVGGQYNTISAQSAFLGGGNNNTINAVGYYGALVGGQFNIVGGSYSAVGGGYQNHATNNYATVPGGSNNVASGVFSFAAGSAAQATNFGAFVWADPEATPFTSTNANSFNVRASGGVRFVTGGAGLTVDGQALITSLPAGVVTNMETGVTLTNLNVGGNLTLPATAAIYAGNNRLLLTDTHNDFYFGLNAGSLTSSGPLNLAIGPYALTSITAGFYNTAIGGDALTYNTTGSQNTALGTFALEYNTSSSANTAMGFGALLANTSGSNNLANGDFALPSNVTGNNNTAVGTYALSALGLNTGVGGSNNIALGYAAGGTFTGNESSNIDLGSPGTAGDNSIIRIGSSQTQAFIAGVITGNGGGLTNLNPANFSGALSAAQLSAGVVTNLATGVTLTNLNVGGSLTLPATPLINAGSSTFLYADGNDNFFAGLAAGNVATSGGYNLAVGASALGANTSGNYNLATGAGALRSNTSGGGNVANGVGVLAVNVTGANNTAVGNFALQELGTSGSAGGTNNIALGYLAGFNFLANESGNIDIGSRGAVGENNIIRLGSSQTDTYLVGNVHDTGMFIGNGGGLTNLNLSLSPLPAGVVTNLATGVTLTNLFVGGNLTLPTPAAIYAGNNSMIYGDANANFFAGIFAGNVLASGSYNTAVGGSALKANTSGSGNVAIGLAALSYNLTGNNNTAEGLSALQNLGTSGSAGGTNNIALGYLAGFNFEGNESGNIDIGSWGNAGENNIIRIGSIQTDTYLTGNVHVNGTVTANGVLLTSDRNVKENFTAINARDVLAKVAALPVTEWNYKTDSKAQPHIGPMAQDFQAAFQLGQDDKHISVVDENGVALAAIQGLNQKVEEKDATIQQQAADIADLKARLERLEQLVSRQGTVNSHQ